MAAGYEVIRNVPGLYRVVALKLLRRTPGVIFDKVPLAALGPIRAIDRVLHESGADSPGAVGNVERPWYMHTCQQDNLLVLHGRRRVELYRPGHGGIVTLDVTAERVYLEGKLLSDRPAMVSWPVEVFHRIHSDDELGSASLNLAVHSEGFDIRTNFNVYGVDVATGQFRVVREGHLDQPGPQ